MKLLIVEDELFVVEDLIEKLNLLGYLDIDIADNFQDAIVLIEKSSPSAALVDIELNGDKDGIELGEVLNNKGIPFIYLSNLQDMDTFARAKKTSPSSNLPKPIGYIALRNCISLALSTSKKAMLDKYIVVPTGSKKIKVDPDQILYLKAAGNNCEIHVFNEGNKRHLSSSALGVVLKKIDLPFFCQTHRSYVVNLNKVHSFDGARLYIDKLPEIEIPISASFITEFRAKFNSL
ncbi:MAG: response regulator [Crocinitomix sp.]|nr:response regulator [Crocinitomix sp.]